jgi:hypothetical protein
MYAMTPYNPTALNTSASTLAHSRTAAAKRACMNTLRT